MNGNFSIAMVVYWGVTYGCLVHRGSSHLQLMARPVISVPIHARLWPPCASASRAYPEAPCSANLRYLGLYYPLTCICLRGPQKIKKITIDSPNGGFPIGKITNHLKQNPVNSWYMIINKNKLLDMCRKFWKLLSKSLVRAFRHDNISQQIPTDNPHELSMKKRWHGPVILPGIDLFR